MPSPLPGWLLTLALILGAPYGAAELFLAAQHEDRLLDAADLIIQRLDAADAASEDLEPEEDDDALLEVSMQPAVLCPDLRPLRRLRGGRT